MIPQNWARGAGGSRAVQDRALGCMSVSMTTSCSYLLTVIAEAPLCQSTPHQDAAPCWGLKEQNAHSETMVQRENLYSCPASTVQPCSVAGASLVLNSISPTMKPPREGCPHMLALLFPTTHPCRLTGWLVLMTWGNFLCAKGVSGIL